MVFRKLRNLVSRQAQPAASKETATNQPSSDEEQPEPILVRGPCSLPTDTEVPVLVVPNKGHKRKRQASHSEADEVHISMLLTKAVKGENKTLKFKTAQTPSN